MLVTSLSENRRCTSAWLRRLRALRSGVAGMNAAGDVLLDAQGNRLLDASGNLVLDDGAGSTCCCGNCCVNYLTFSVTISGVTVGTSCVTCQVYVGSALENNHAYDPSYTTINGSYTVTNQCANCCVYWTQLPWQYRANNTLGADCASMSAVDSTLFVIVTLGNGSTPYSCGSTCVTVDVTNGLFLLFHGSAVWNCSSTNKTVTVPNSGSGAWSCDTTNNYAIGCTENGTGSFCGPTTGFGFISVPPPSQLIGSGGTAVITHA